MFHQQPPAQGMVAGKIWSKALLRVRRLLKDIQVRFFTENKIRRVGVSLPDGTEATLNLDRWSQRMLYAYSPCLFINCDGKGSHYVVAHARRPDGQRSSHRDVAREIMALMMIDEESAGGVKADSQGFIAVLRDGDIRNLRDENIAWEERRGWRATYEAVWCARWRRDLVAELRGRGLPDDEIPAWIAAEIARRGKTSGSPED